MCSWIMIVLGWFWYVCVCMYDWNWESNQRECKWNQYRQVLLIVTFLYDGASECIFIYNHGMRHIYVYNWIDVARHDFNSKFRFWNCMEKWLSLISGTNQSPIQTQLKRIWGIDSYYVLCTRIFKKNVAKACIRSQMHILMHVI